MTPDERFEELQILMPGTPEGVLRYLSAEHAISPWESAFEERNEYIEPVRDFFRKFRIDKKKLQRILNVCGEAGARWLNNRHFYWNQEMARLQGEELAVVADATRQLSKELEGDQLADAVNEVVSEATIDDDDPWQNFDAAGALRAMHCDDVLKRHGKYNGRSLRDCNLLLRSLIRKVETDARKRSPEELLGLTPPRSQFPNVVFADRRFGDGSEYVQELDSNGKVVRQYKKSGVNPVVPEFKGMSRQQAQAKCLELLAKRQQEKQGRKSG